MNPAILHQKNGNIFVSAVDKEVQICLSTKDGSPFFGISISTDQTALLIATLERAFEAAEAQRLSGDLMHLAFRKSVLA